MLLCDKIILTEFITSQLPVRHFIVPEKYQLRVIKNWQNFNTTASNLNFTLMFCLIIYLSYDIF
jgi:hypothetical protein